MRPPEKAQGLLSIDPPSNRQPGQFGAGSIHHIAFRAKDTEHQLALRDLILQHGIGVTEVIDRSYFRSIYFRVPAGILFEIATDQPGFAIDEKPEELGQRFASRRGSRIGGIKLRHFYHPFGEPLSWLTNDLVQLRIK